jgi:hypothetical protein
MRSVDGLVDCPSVVGCVMCPASDAVWKSMSAPVCGRVRAEGKKLKKTAQDAESVKGQREEIDKALRATDEAVVAEGQDGNTVVVGRQTDTEKEKEKEKETETERQTDRQKDT